MLILSAWDILYSIKGDEMDKKACDRQMATNLWMRGIDWCVRKVGKRWALVDCFGNFPLFNTKKAAYETATAFVMLGTE